MLRNRVKHLLKNNQFLYNSISSLYKRLSKLYEKSFFYFFFHLFRLFPINSRKIILCSYFGKGYGDNSKYIAEEIIDKGLDYDMVWLLNKELMNNHNLPSQVRPVLYDSIWSIYEMATAAVWIDNARQPYYIRKRKGQYYIQAWHGSPAMKKIEKDAENSLSEGYVRQAIFDSKKADLFLSNCKWYSDLARSSFWYDGEILECGTPRNDILFKTNVVLQNEVRQYFNLSKHSKIALYAPTFRTDYSLDAYKLDYKNFIAKLIEKFGGEWTLLVRLHPNIQNKADELLLGEDIINASGYDDLQELLTVADLVVTDYSSLMFDFALRRKPCLLYAVDIEEYKKDRDFYFSFNELPFPLAESNSQLMSVIERFDNDKYVQDVNKFFLNIGSVENGQASELVVERIKQVTY